MPRYDFRCEAGHKFEVQLPFGSASVQPCERCGKPAQRQMVAPTVVFKGGGFYKTSHRSDARSDNSSSSSSSSSDTKTPPVTESPSTSHDTSTPSES